MVEGTRTLDIACHGLLILGGLLVCLPIYFAFVVGSHTVSEVLAVPPPWLPGRTFFANAATAWEKGNLGRLFVNSFIVAVGIAVGKIAVSLLSAFAFETPRPIEGAGIGINYGFDSVRFQAPVKTGSRVRARFFLADLNVRPSGWIQSSYDVTIEIENSRKPALTARWLTLTVLERKEETA